MISEAVAHLYLSYALRQSKLERAIVQGPRQDAGILEKFLGRIQFGSISLIQFDEASLTCKVFSDRGHDKLNRCLPLFAQGKFSVFLRILGHLAARRCMSCVSSDN